MGFPDQQKSWSVPLMMGNMVIARLNEIRVLNVFETILLPSYSTILPLSLHVGTTHQINLARMLFWGQHGVTRDLPLAIEYFNEYLANNPADPLANYDMAVILLRVSVRKVGFVINKFVECGCNKPWATSKIRKLV